MGEIMRKIRKITNQCHLWRPQMAWRDRWWAFGECSVPPGTRTKRERITSLGWGAGWRWAPSGRQSQNGVTHLRSAPPVTAAALDHAAAGRADRETGPRKKAKRNYGRAPDKPLLTVTLPNRFVTVSARNRGITMEIAASRREPSATENVTVGREYREREIERLMKAARRSRPIGSRISGKTEMSKSRRFPPRWSIEELNNACFIVRGWT